MGSWFLQQNSLRKLYYVYVNNCCIHSNISNRKKLALWAFCPEFVKIRKCNHEGRRFPVSDKYFIVVFIPLEPKSCQKSDIHCKKCFIKVLMWKIKYQREKLGGPQRSAPRAALQQQRAGLGYELHQSLLEGSRRLASALAAAVTARMMTNTCKTHRSTNPARNVSGNCHFVDIYNIQFIISLPVLIKYVRHKSKIMLLVCTIFMVGPGRTGTERIIYYYLYVYLVLMTK